MPIAVICCHVLEREIRAVAARTPAVSHLEVLDWGLHIRPKLLVEALCKRIEALQNNFDAVVLGYGRCQALDRLPHDFRIPIFYPVAEDCIGVLLGQDRYEEELRKDARTWFLTPGWTEMGMEFVFHELQLHEMAEKGYDPLQLAHRMLKDFTRALFIDMDLGDGADLLKKAHAIADEFHMKLEITEGSLTSLERAVSEAIRHCSARR